MGVKIYTKAELATIMPTQAIVESEHAQLDSAIGDAWHALRLAEQRETKTIEKATAAQEVARKASDEAAQRRLALGRLLAERRKSWPARGPNAKGWGLYLSKLGIEQQTALNYMNLAGYVEVSQTDESCLGNIPTYAEAGIDKRPRRTDEQPDPPRAANDEQPIALTTVPTARTERSGGRGKPAWLMRALVRDYSVQADLVCDPLAGWGSTLRAALDEGRRAIGSEIDPQIAAAAGELPIRVGDWKTALSDITCDAIICDPPYSARTHEASRKFGNAREDGSPLDGLGPEYAAWTRDHVFDFVRSWTPRCRGWMVALTDHNLIHDWQDAYEDAGWYAFAPVICLIRGMTVRLCGDGPSSWAIYAMVSRPRNLSRWRTLPGGYVGSREHLEVEGDA